jgi:hypothetical protein
VISPILKAYPPHPCRSPIQTPQPQTVRPIALLGSRDDRRRERVFARLIPASSSMDLHRVSHHAELSTIGRGHPRHPRVPDCTLTAQEKPSITAPAPLPDDAAVQQGPSLYDTDANGHHLFVGPFFGLCFVLMSIPKLGIIISIGGLGLGCPWTTVARCTLPSDHVERPQLDSSDRLAISWWQARFRSSLRKERTASPRRDRRLCDRTIWSCNSPMLSD